MLADVWQEVRVREVQNLITAPRVRHPEKTRAHHVRFHLVG